jgi:hypothetical protein
MNGKMDDAAHDKGLRTGTPDGGARLGSSLHWYHRRSSCWPTRRRWFDLDLAMRSVVDNTNGRKRRDDVRWEKKKIRSFWATVGRGWFSCIRATPTDWLFCFPSVKIKKSVRNTNPTASLPRSCGDPARYPLPSARYI